MYEGDASSMKDGLAGQNDDNTVCRLPKLDYTHSPA
jgi:hypothetical protein